MNAVESRVNMKDIFAGIYTLAALGFAAYVGWNWFNTSSAIEAIEKLDPLYNATIEKELDSSFKVVGQKRDDKGVMINDSRLIKCVRAVLEHKVSGQKYTNYFVVDVTEKMAIRISESDASRCVSK